MTTDFCHVQKRSCRSRQKFLFVSQGRRVALLFSRLITSHIRDPLTTVKTSKNTSVLSIISPRAVHAMASFVSGAKRVVNLGSTGWFFSPCSWKFSSFQTRLLYNERISTAATREVVQFYIYRRHRWVWGKWEPMVEKTGSTCVLQG